jgi:hypothetical protein
MGFALVAAAFAASSARGAAAARAEEPPPAPPARTGVVYLGGQRIAAPYTLAVERGRLLINGVPAAAGRAPLDFELSDAQRATGARIRALDARVRRLADSLRVAGARSAEVLDAAAREFETSPLAARVTRNPTGSVTIEWRGVPGSTVVDLPSYVSGAAEPIDRAAAVEQERADLARLLERGGFYAAGEGYRVAFAGGLADSMEAAIARFLASNEDTLRLGVRRYERLGRDLRREQEKGRTR